MTVEMTPETKREIVRGTFNAAADTFDAPALFFWEPCGRRTVELAGVGPGQRVLDVCCGAGASALEAARRVGPRGRVVGVDLAERLLGLAAAKAATQGLGNVAFRRADMTELPFPDHDFDAVVCVFGYYFATDLPAAAAGLWRLVRPGGVLAVTTWGRRALEPFHATFLDAVAAVRPELAPRRVSWDRIDTPATLAAALRAGGVPDPLVVEEEITRPWDGADAWTLARGSGYRLIVEALGADAAAVRAGLAQRLRAASPCALTGDVLYARARLS